MEHPFKWGFLPGCVPFAKPPAPRTLSRGKSHVGRDKGIALQKLNCLETSAMMRWSGAKAVPTTTAL